MDATGFERDEIKPEMDPRKDLSVVPAAFPSLWMRGTPIGITIELEEFMDARTVKDIAQRISGVIARQPGGSLPTATKAVAPEPVPDERLKPPEDEESVKRLVFNRVPMELPASIPMELSRASRSSFSHLTGMTPLPERQEKICRRDYGVDTIPMRFMQGTLGAGEDGHDILTDEGSGKAAEKISGLASLAGMVITLPQGGSGRVRGMADVARLFRGLFLP